MNGMTDHHPLFLVLLLFLTGLPSSGAISRNVSFRTTWYGAKDNCPPGGSIAYPTIHQVAGGTGTYDDPITFAGVKEREEPGTIYYISNWKKYFIMEDDCEECDDEWRKSRTFHIDLWMGPDTCSPGPFLIECENELTGYHTVTIEPVATLPVDRELIFDVNRTKNGGCLVPVHPCHSDGDACGNLCQTPNAATCQQLAKLFALPLARFLALNRGLNCSVIVPQGETVCMGGTCGD